MAKMPLESQINRAIAVLAAQTKPVRYIVRKPRRGGKARGGKMRHYWVKHRPGRSGYARDALFVVSRRPIDEYSYVRVEAADAAAARAAFKRWGETPTGGKARKRTKR